jgi:hypothetical protein
MAGDSGWIWGIAPTMALNRKQRKDLVGDCYWLRRRIHSKPIHGIQTKLLSQKRIKCGQRTALPGRLKPVAERAGLVMDI